MRTILIVTFLAGTVCAQIPVEQARQRLLERITAERATTQASEPATTRSALVPTTAAATQPGDSALNLERRAIALLRADHPHQASALLDRACEDVPEAERSRSLVLNRAIADLRLRINVTRAVRDLTVYLENHLDDEMAANMLGSAGTQAIARDKRFEKSKLCDRAVVTLRKAIGELEAKRPGYRKWGGNWLNADLFDDNNVHVGDTFVGVQVERSFPAALAYGYGKKVLPKLEWPKDFDPIDPD
jgi:hypothetical protein